MYFHDTFYIFNLRLTILNRDKFLFNASEQHKTNFLRGDEIRLTENFERYMGFFRWRECAVRS